MNQNYSDFLPLRVTHVSPDGKRRYDSQDKQRLIEACLQPGVSVAGMALKAGVNANLLRRWIRKHQDKQDGAAAAATGRIERASAAFVPVVEIRSAGTQVEPEQSTKPELLPAPARREPVRASQRPPLPSRLVAQLPNGVSVELECTEQDAALVTAMIETLGRCHVPARR